jgi:hypothetical protein
MKLRRYRCHCHTLRGAFRLAVNPRAESRWERRERRRQCLRYILDTASCWSPFVVFLAVLWLLVVGMNRGWWPWLR